MLKKALNFIKYNNATVLILAIIFVFGTGVFAATETGQAVIGAKQTGIEGVDNTLLLEADLENLGMDYKIEKIEEDDKYYYITYTFIDLVVLNNAWQYQIQEKIRKVSKKQKKDLGEYLAEELGEEYGARIKELREERTKELEGGEEKRFEVVEYDGLIGQTLEAVNKVFPNYEPVKKRQIPSPSLPPTILLARESGTEEELVNDLTDIYDNYIESNDPDYDNIFGILDNCPYDYNPDQDDSDNDGVGDICDLDQESGDVTDGEIVDDSTSTSSDEIIEEDIILEEPTEEIIEEEIATSTPEEESPSAEATEDEPDVEIIELPVE